MRKSIIACAVVVVGIIGASSEAGRPANPRDASGDEARIESLRSTLRLTLKKIHPSLTYTVQDDLLLITTVESLKDMEVATYEVSELLGKGETADVLAIKLQRIFGISDKNTSAPCRLSIEGHDQKLIVRGPEWQQHKVAKLLTSLKPK